MKRFLVEVAKGRLKIHGLVQEVGQDILVSIWGGTRPHIGVIGIAIARPSLKETKKGVPPLQILPLTQELIHYP